VVDDPENDGHVTSALQRERSWSWFNRAVAIAGTPQTNVLVLGTALHRDCLVLRLTRTAGRPVSYLDGPGQSRLFHRKTPSATGRRP
jgi:hypothetical protein